jgi:hypothetical protein
MRGEPRNVARTLQVSLDRARLPRNRRRARHTRAAMSGIYPSFKEIVEAVEQG